MLKVLSENLQYVPLSFYRQLKFPLDAVLYKTRKPNQSTWNLLQWIFGEIPLHFGKTRMKIKKLEVGPLSTKEKIYEKKYEPLRSRCVGFGGSTTEKNLIFMVF